MKTIPLTQGKFALVDDEDYDRFSEFKWHAARRRNTFYAARWSPRHLGKRKLLLLHREILLAPVGVEIDHKSGDGLDNQKENLRFATTKQNGQNQRKQPGTSSQFKGVYWSERRGKWYAQIHLRRRSAKFLGGFDLEKDAARAYDAAARKLFGEFACPNFTQQA